MSGLLGAIQFLTRLPVRTRAAVPHERAVPWFPAVGAAIGALVGGVAAGSAELVPLPVAASLGVIVGLFVTGAFHEDGLGDVADAFGGGWTREQRFEILRDSRHGTYGVAAIAASIGLRVVAAASVTSSAALFGGLLATHVLGRTAIVVALLTVPPARESGLGADTARHLRRRDAALGMLVGTSIVALVVGWWLGPLLVATLVATAAVAGLAWRKIGGLAGDVLGAVEQVVECATLVVVSGLAARHAVWWA